MSLAIGLASCGTGPSPTVGSAANSPGSVASPAASPSEIAQPVQSSAAVSSPTSSDRSTQKLAEAQKPVKPQPSKGVVKRLTIGDLKCYVTLVDANNVSHELGATFEVCNKQSVLNRSVNLSYQTVAVNDCRSNEPCGKTRQESLISRMEIAPTGSSPAANTQTFSNGEWTIVVSNLNSWSGVNNTGNLGYRGCDAKGSCIDLKGGQMTCRQGVCTMGWSNGDYRYALESPIDNPDQPAASGATRLTVRQGDRVILNQTGFKVISSSP